MARDPVCGMDVDEKKAAAQSEHEGLTHFFCSRGCKEAFDKDPDKFKLKTSSSGESQSS